ncbi:hypothetical protein HGB07_03785 [Candidatus Roizmanbacteria bacterium]|nr:hypothetical protein [Candidatus Roizmanbacteria bacterium]
MFSFLLKKKKQYRPEYIEHVIGVVLSNRSIFINPADIFRTNIYSGYAIGRLFERDKKRLNDEFDFIAIHFIYNALSNLGVDIDTFNSALKSVFDNYDIDASYRAFCDIRIVQYYPLDYRELATEFISSLKVQDFPERFQSESCRILSCQFEGVYKKMSKYILAELKEIGNDYLIERP